MFTKDRIEELLELYETSDNFETFTQMSYEGRTLLKRDLLEAKVQVDRWGTYVNTWIFHPSQKQTVEALFPEEVSVLSAHKKALLALIELNDSIEFDKKENVSDAFARFEKKPFNFWGANVYYSDDLSPEQAIGLSLTSTGTLRTNDSSKITNSIIVFVVPKVDSGG